MLQIRRPALIFDKQKVYRTNANVENQSLAGVEVKTGKEVVVLFQSDAAEVLKGEERTQLFKIVNACKLKEEDVVLVNTAFAKNADLNWLRNNFPLRTLIVFGDIPLSKNLLLKKHVAYGIDGINIIRSESLTKLTNSAPDKAALWKELRGIFGV